MFDHLTATPLTLLGVVAVYFTAMITMKALGPLVPEPRGDRFASLDGLRGLLALFVVSHHSLYWHEKLLTSSWTMPSILYENLGKGSVCLFFMVSSFLFFGKVLQANRVPFDWLRFAISRLLRLTPLYLIAITLLLIEVGNVSHWQLLTGPRELITEVTDWLAFTLPGAPDINHVKDTSRIVAGVTWSLTYEWFFYAILPLIALLAARRVAIPALLASLAFSLFIYRIFHPNPWILATFLGGMAAAWIVRWGKLNRLLRSTWMSPWVVLLLYQSWTLNYKPWNPGTLFLLTLAFTLIAAGNNLFGLLTNRLTRKLGEVSYGIYLFHGMVLFALLQLSPLAGNPDLLHPFPYLLTVLLATLITVLISSIGFRLIEAPGMALAGPLTARLRSRLSQRTWSPG
jgi:peptidoglycan/LPS O-acetylase OafA/YrhL